LVRQSARLFRLDDAEVETVAKIDHKLGSAIG
jgi:hypothetical protein